jgi:hypothetical protein
MRKENTHNKTLLRTTCKRAAISDRARIGVLCTDCALLPPVKQGASHRRMEFLMFLLSNYLQFKIFYFFVKIHLLQKAKKRTKFIVTPFLGFKINTYI